MLMSSSLVLHLFKEFVGGVFIAVLLHLGQVTLLWSHRCIDLQTHREGFSVTQKENTIVQTNCCIPHTHLFKTPFLYLDHTVVNRSILFLSQHHQGDDDDGCYDNPSNHKSNNGPLIGSNILSEKHLQLIGKRRTDISAGPEIKDTIMVDEAQSVQAGLHGGRAVGLVWHQGVVTRGYLLRQLCLDSLHQNSWEAKGESECETQHDDRWCARPDLCSFLGIDCADMLVMFQRVLPVLLLGTDVLLQQGQHLTSLGGAEVGLQGAEVIFQSQASVAVEQSLHPGHVGLHQLLPLSSCLPLQSLHLLLEVLQKKNILQFEMFTLYA
ncbi:hypothetical protein F7725_001969 [Dissostichus mawsoni]|uniref:Uncharacterized protein n=1 Tax=Dissostichus mawsoni TaxID=36200 RepID=A0A7J5Y1A2_DISMA|nr:hypothetical protein F7725_001969 [Dissostichus mawsoni]